MSNLIVDTAREALGTPYRHQGRVAGVGLDCIGLAIYVAQRLGYDYIDGEGYGRIPKDGLLEQMVDKQPCLFRVYDRQPGDLVLMRYTSEPQHVAIITDIGLIHCSYLTGRVVEHRIDLQIEKQILKTYRFKG